MNEKKYSDKKKKKCCWGDAPSTGEIPTLVNEPKDEKKT